jgi:hypothetical protein
MQALNNLYKGLGAVLNAGVGILGGYVLFTGVNERAPYLNIFVGGIDSKLFLFFCYFH